MWTGEGQDRWEGFTEELGSHQAMKGEPRLQIEKREVGGPEWGEANGVANGADPGGI